MSCKTCKTAEGALKTSMGDFCSGPCIHDYLGWPSCCEQGKGFEQYPPCKLHAELKEQADRIARMEQSGDLDPECLGCKVFYEKGLNVLAPGHKASRRCESGKHPHCTCDTCF